MARRLLLALTLLARATCPSAAVEGLPTWDCQRKGPCTYFYDSPESLGCNTQPPECIPASKAGASGQQCSGSNGNIKGTVLVLDVNSLFYSGGPNHPPAVTTAVECCEACKAQADCNSWTFCWRLEGCGAGCNSTKGGALDQIDVAMELGPFNNCADGSKYSFRTCTLKRVADTASPLLWGASGEGDWTSGTLVWGLR